jgi:uncharacterized Fe-S cluster protein YjdI
MVVEGSKVRIVFEGVSRIHWRGCIPSRPGVFVPGGQGDRIHPDEAPPRVDTARIRGDGTRTKPGFTA